MNGANTEAHNHRSLDWIAPGLDENLATARRLIESYLSGADNAQKLVECAALLAPVKDALARVELTSAVLLTDHIISLLDTIKQAQLSESSSASGQILAFSLEDAYQALLGGLAQLPNYLVRARSRDKDLVSDIIVIVNDIRAAMRTDLLVNDSVFALSQFECPVPDVSALQDADKKNVLELLAAANHALDRLGSQADSQRECTDELYSIANSLAEFFGGSGNGSAPLFVDALKLLMQAVTANSAYLSLSGKYAVAQAVYALQRQLAGEDAADAETLQQQHLLVARQLLFAIAVCDSSQPNVQAFKDQYGLLSALSIQHASELLRLGTPDADTMEVVFDGICSDLGVLKIALERKSEGSESQASFAEMAAMASTLQHTMKLAQYDGWAEQIADVANSLTALEADGESDLAVVQEIADKLHGVEQGLRDLHIGGNRSESEISALHEAKRSIASIRLNLAHRLDSDLHFFDDKLFLDYEPLNCLNQQFKEVAGAMQIMGLTPVVSALARTDVYLDSQLVEEQNIDAAEKIIEGLVAIESFLEAAKYNQQQRVEQWLVAAVDVLTPPSDTVTEVAIDAPVVQADTATDNPPQISSPQEQSVQLPPVLREPLEGEFDEEIVEIFLEEAQEVFEEIQALSATWISDPQANDAMADIRRGFHTLKGSGRMAGAEHVGETAWAIENLINRMADGSVPIDAQRASLIGEAISYIPHTIECFEQRLVPYPAPMMSLIERAETLANNQDASVTIGESIALLEELSSGDSGTAAHVDSAVAVEPDAEAVSALPKETLADEASLPVEASSVEASSIDEASLSDEETLSDIGAELNDIYAASALESSEDSGEDSVEGVSAIDAQDQQKEEPLAEAIQQNDVQDVQEGEAQSEDAELEQPEIPQADIEEIQAEDVQDLPAEAASIEEPTETEDEIFCDSAEDDHYLQAIFVSELEVQLMVVDGYLSQPADQADAYPSEAVERALHTLAGGARIAGNDFIAELFAPAEILVNLIRKRCAISEEERQLLGDIYHWTQAQLKAGTLNQVAEQDQRNAQAYIDKLNQLIADDIEGVSAERSVSVENDIIFNFAELLQAWRTVGEPPETFETMLSVLAQLEQASADGQQAAIENQCAVLAQAYRCFEQSGLHYQAYLALSDAHDDLVNMLDRMAAGQEVEASVAIKVLQEMLSEEQQLLEQLSSNANASGQEAAAESSSASGIDQEIVSIFLDESEDLIEDVEAGVQQWLNNRDDLTYLESLLRPLHTIKGGARMAGLEAIGNISHEFETHLLSASNGDTKTDAKFFKATSKFVTDLVAAVAEIRNSLNNNVDPAQQTQQGAGDEKAKEGKAREEEKRDNEVIRVSSSLLENLVNLAGETSISRSLIEEQVSDFSQSIEEIDSTILRLKEQLRRLEIEMEAQIEFRKEQVESEGQEEFDPLEMDRYSQVQQLSKSLIESASDLNDLKSTLTEKTRDMETLLLQQSRINTSLQEGLMRTRTVPLSRYIIPRLRRIVRQVSGELDKPVSFDVNNAGGELDRSMIERMVAPLEHVLRNAIDHGIESEDERKQQGKPEMGAIRLNIRREGGDVVLELSDDGKGIDVTAVRKKAIAKGLMKKSDELSDEEVMQFIFAAGFSTAKELTQLSGRGVGMDVVQSEMTELGGSVEMHSRQGQGTVFTFRLPFTVSMNRALLVSAGGETLAVPLDSIEGIVRVSPFELEEYYGDGAAEFFYAGQQYEFGYLGNLINGSNYQVNPDMLSALPVLLVRGGDKFVALQVDRLLGSREIVVKGLGKQFANLEGIAGATVLGDGSVVMIADLVALVRSEQALIESDNVVSLDKSRDRLLAMVVDDSVTVRKVTTRLLERRGMDVITAKDGLDAILQLDDIKPDFILLDIEMPRMDGFEVVARIRNESKLCDVPIIMITSRTGDKHRERALGLGANGYLGKPYQEAVLFDAINEVLPNAIVDEQFGT